MRRFFGRQEREIEREINEPIWTQEKDRLMVKNLKASLDEQNMLQGQFALAFEYLKKAAKK